MHCHKRSGAIIKRQNYKVNGLYSVVFKKASSGLNLWDVSLISHGNQFSHLYV